LHMVTRRPRHLRSRPSEEAVRPLPRDDDTPPVKKMYLVGTRVAAPAPSPSEADSEGGPAVACPPGGRRGPSMSGT
jgi:hypothetical protein